MERRMRRQRRKKRKTRSGKKVASKRHAYGRTTLKPVNYQTGKRKNIKADRVRRALLSGKRRSGTGKIYWEIRKNRSDRKGRRL